MIIIIIGNNKVLEIFEINLLRQSQYLLLISAFINKHYRLWDN